MPHPLGKALQGVRAGMDHVLFDEEASARVPVRILIASRAFIDGAPMAAKYTLDGAKASPPLVWQGVPAGSGALVLLIEDADSPTPRPLVHALAPDLLPRDGELHEGALGEDYRPPDPPPGHGPHRYVIQLYALTHAPAKPIRDKGDLRKALAECGALAKGRLIGTYERL